MNKLVKISTEQVWTQLFLCLILIAYANFMGGEGLNESRNTVY